MHRTSSEITPSMCVVYVPLVDVPAGRLALLLKI